MKKRQTLEPGFHRIPAALLVAALLLGACGPAATGSGDTPLASVDAQDAAETAPSPGPAVAESEGFKAEATSPISVQLTWSRVAGAIRYEIDGSVVGQELFPLAIVGPDATSYEMLPVPDDAQLAFRLTAVAADGGGSSRTVRVTTPVEEPNPYSVEVMLEQSGGAMPGFDPSNLDPSTFDFSALDDADMDSDDFDLSSLLPGPTTITQEIGPQGGRIEATSSNGTIYSLTILEGALALPMGISLTPIASLEGLPPQVELLGAVQIEPEGLALSEPALLMITLPDPSSETDDRMVVGIEFGTEGDDFYFLPTVGDDAVATLGGGAAKLAKLVMPPPADSRGGSRVSRLESRGAAKASPAAVIQNRRDNPTADDTRSVSQSAAAADAKNYENDDLAPLEIPSPPFEQWLAQNIIDVAKESAAGLGAAKNLAEAVDHLEYLERFEDRYSDDLARSRESAWQAVVESIAAELKKAAAADCDSEEHRYGTKLAQRLAGNGPGRTQSDFDRELARRYSEQHGARGQDLIRKMLESEAKCPRAFHVKGSLGDTSFDQDVCDYRVEFELTGETPAGDLRHVMRPSYPGFDRGGDYRWSGRLSGGGEEWTAAGFGTYLLINDENGWPVMMKLNDTGCGMNGEESSCQTASGFLPLVPLKKGCGK